MLERARERRNPFTYTNPDAVASALSRLASVDPEPWAEVFSALAVPHEEKAARAEAAGDMHRAMEHYLVAYDYHRVARYPAPNSPAKLRAYRLAQVDYLKAAHYFDPPLEVVEISFPGCEGEGHVLVGHLRKPTGVVRPPVVINWGGIDSFKERRVEPYLAAGLATLAIDMPGVGDSPIKGAAESERLWDPIFDWIAHRPDVDEDRIGLIGASTGGYWAAKLAHTHAQRIRAAVTHGGPAHYAFTPDWIARAQRGEYPFELAETLASAFGLSTYAEWVEYSPQLSLLRQGVLDRPCASMLCVNGVEDSVFPIADMYLLLEHGDPKSARFFQGGHMGQTPQTQPTITRWLMRHLES